MIGRLAILAVAGGSCMVCLAEEAPTKNPFAKPAFMRGVQAPVTSNDPANPFAPPQLRAILLSDDAALANIDGILVGTGEEYEGYRVQQISEEHVVLTRREERLVLELFAESDDE